MANIVFAGTDISLIGAFATPEISGMLDLVTIEQAETWLPGRDAPALTDVRRRFGDIKIKCVLRADDRSRATFLANLQLLKAALSPALGAQFLTRTDIADKMVLAQSMGFPVTEDTLPYIMEVGEFTLTFRRLGWWMDTAETTENILTSPGSISQDGDTEAVPLYTCTVTGSLPTGLSFTVDGETFTYDGALVATDLLDIDTDLYTVELNGVSAIANVNTASAFPRLLPGLSTITLSSALFTLRAVYRRRWE